MSTENQSSSAGSKPKGKIIKKLLKGVGYLLLGVLLLIVLLVFAIRTEWVQNKLTTYVADHFSEEWSTTVSLDRIYIDFFSDVHLEGLYVADQHADTLLYVAELTARLADYQLDTTQFHLGTVALHNGCFYLKRYANEDQLNLQFIIDAFASGDSSSKPKPLLTANEVWIDGLQFRYANEQVARTDFGIDYNHLDVSDLHLMVHDFVMDQDTLMGRLDTLRLKERSGLRLRELSGNLRIDPTNLRIDSLLLRTNESQIATDLHFRHNSYKGYKNFIQEVHMQLDIDSADVQGADIAFFAPALEGIRQRVSIRGKVKGPVNNLSMRQLDLRFGSSSFVKGNVEMAGLPDIQETFILADLKQIETNRWDLSQLPYPPFKNRTTLPISDNFTNLGTMRFKGNFTGFIYDFVAYGTLDSDIGTLRSDLHLTRDPETDDLVYDGELKSKKFHLGKLVGASGTLGEITMDMKVDGRGTKATNVEAQLNGLIQEFSVNGYRYNNMRVNGALNDQLFDGELVVKDPNIDLDFNGSVNFGARLPEFHFVAQMKEVNLPALNLAKRDTSSRFSAYVEMDLEGNSLENMQGTVDILEAEYREQGRRIAMDTLALTAEPHALGRNISVKSTYLDGQLVGRFNTSELAESFFNLLGEPLPALLQQRAIKTARQRFDYDFTLKKADEITAIFYPDLVAEEDIRMKGHYYVGDRSVTMKLTTPSATISGVRLTQPLIDLKLEKGILNLVTEIDRAALSDSIWVSNFAVNSKGVGNTVQVNLGWEHQRPSAYNGNLSALVNVESRSRYAVTLLESDLILADTTWQVHADGPIMLDSGTVSFGNLIFEHAGQKLQIDGRLSNSYNDVLDVVLTNIDLNWLNLLTEDAGFALAGRIDGETHLSNPFDGLVVDSKLNLKDLYVNQREIGEGRLTAKYNTQTEDVLIRGFLGEPADPFLSYNGKYLPKKEENNIDVNFFLRHFEINLLEPMLEGQLSEMGGLVHGNVQLTGSTRQPLLNGQLNLDKAALKVDYLNVRYTIDHADIIVAEDWFGVDYVTIKDPNGNSAFCNATVLHNNFAKFNFDVSVFTQKFRLLDTDLEDNSLYYGTAEMSGSFSVGGYADNLIIDVEGKTQKGTEFFIPLGGSEEVSESDFITFVNPDKAGEEAEPKVDLSGIQLNIDLEVTKDATAQIIFDEKVGDIIKANGDGNIQMAINTLGTFNIFGEYVIDKGDYLFTLQNIINKRFEIKKGSSIAWSGDPYEAQLDIDAIYGLRTTLYDLTGDSTQRGKSQVDVRLSIRDRLSEPQFGFNIDFPGAPGSIASDLVSSMSEQDLNRQVFSLLILNRFVAFDNTVHSENIGSTSTSELLSNQLSNWLSKISNDFDIGFKYRPGDEISSDEVELALSTQLFNDRVTIEGNLGVVGDNPATDENTGGVVGDFQVEYKIGDGRMRAKVYNKSNDYNLANANNAPYTQGAGIFVREEFNNFGDLWRRLFGKPKKPKTPKPKKGDAAPTSGNTKD